MKTNIATLATLKTTIQSDVKKHKEEILALKSTIQENLLREMTLIKDSERLQLQVKNSQSH